MCLTIYIYTHIYIYIYIFLNQQNSERSHVGAYCLLANIANTELGRCCFEKPKSRSKFHKQGWVETLKVATGLEEYAPYVINMKATLNQ